MMLRFFLNNVFLQHHTETKTHASVKKKPLRLVKKKTTRRTRRCKRLLGDLSHEDLKSSFMNTRSVKTPLLFSFIFRGVSGNLLRLSVLIPETPHTNRLWLKRSPYSQLFNHSRRASCLRRSMACSCVICVKTSANFACNA